MKVQMIQASRINNFEEKINEFIRYKEIIDIKYSTVVFGGNIIYSTMILYK